jgi:hypothetical protein
MSEDNTVPASPTEHGQRQSEFKMAFNDFLLDHMIFKDGGTPIFDLVGTMLLKCPQPASTVNFIQTERPLILEDIGKLVQ